eukprot:CAMPEP_0181337014 /NCGR_PEP_ID=MMETSP1101-20121128/27760_1 /TAXON_ID=46948 /ORGANISM="Rhodomonas abbreviata, Strain Caron Lab Isolate" /LENGTH=37 /DNA_ID= /DNA_START= /DNA_END= /DNA_ORIENTATION=
MIAAGAFVNNVVSPQQPGKGVLRERFSFSSPSGMRIT